MVTAWQRPAPEASRHWCWCVSTSSGDQTVIADEAGADLWSPTISPDGSAVAFIGEAYSTPVRAPRITLGYLRFGENSFSSLRSVPAVSVTWSRDARDGQVLIVTADEGGRRPVFRIGIRDGGVERVDH